jgi:hypothetical protein
MILGSHREREDSPTLSLTVTRRRQLTKRRKLPINDFILIYAATVRSSAETGLQQNTTVHYVEESCLLGCYAV